MMKEMMFLRGKMMKIAKYILQIKIENHFAKHYFCNIKIAKIHHFVRPFYFAMSACQLMPFLSPLRKTKKKKKKEKPTRKERTKEKNKEIRNNKEKEVERNAKRVRAREAKKRIFCTQATECAKHHLNILPPYGVIHLVNISGAHKFA